MFRYRIKRLSTDYKYRVIKHCPHTYRGRGLLKDGTNSKRLRDFAMKLNILGCHSATPTENTHTTSQVLEVKEHLFLNDFGEGTQIQLRQQKIKFSRIKHIFISHLHGDHFYGLVGLISTFRLLGRTADLHIYGPKGIKEVLSLQFKLANSWTNYNLFFHELENKESVLIFEDDSLTVHTIPLDHRVYTNGFLFQEKPGLRRLNKEKIKNYNIPHYDFQNLKHGNDLVLEDGTELKNDKVSLDPNPIKVMHSAVTLPIMNL